ncbi:two-component system sensor histidine kinase NtrB [Phenylobacterium sp.]|jgi:signal transduction histidine kinase|uniref:two-component system sensor histidine kinase NtrB n=1 Tax=Phenylobacterium sp. TaxID=1871053 RepID=UPI002F41062E
MSSFAPAPSARSDRLPANEGGVTDDIAGERLDALRLKSGALTHDFNNLLGVILSASERLAAELPEGGEQRKLALLATEAAERGAELLRRALDLAQGREAGPTAVDAGETLDTLRRMARQAIAPGVRLDVHDPELPLACRGERTGLEMSLLNLCLNAGHATPDGGRVTVQVQTVQIDAAERLGLEPGAYAAFSVRDTGQGMAPQVLARATDPLFTTKSTGTGLGLSSVLDFARASGGTLSLWSREGQGTTATLYLPLLHADPAAVAA